MEGCLARVSEAQLEAYRSDPDRAIAELAGSLGFDGGAEGLLDMLDGCLPAPLRMLVGLVPRRLRAWMLRKAFPALVAPAEGPTAEAGDPAAPAVPVIHVHKDWHALHWLLTGSAEDVEGPLGEVIMGGEALSDQPQHDLGYGPMCFLEPSQVVAVHNALQALGHKAILGRWDKAAMREADLYGGHWGADDRASVSRNLGRVLELYASAAAEGQAVLHWIQ